jgi:hypothetical protein
MSHHITFVTYNLGSVPRGTIPFVVEEIMKHQPNFVAFQECARLDWEIIAREMKTHGLTHQRFDECLRKQVCDMLFSSTALTKKDYRFFTRTNEERGIITYIAKIPYSKQNDDGVVETNFVEVCVGTTQLERDARYLANRKFQISELLPIVNSMNSTSVCVLGMDTRIESWQNNAFDELTFASSWQDTWKECGSNKNEFTTYSRDRPDRILYRGLECVRHDNLSFGTEDLRKGVIAQFALVNI